ncbi:hypothetical protein N7450_007826 [Penicillium hetheringtonii]|uniref:Uncharacterized protein n=1 Tax=Penicillium hetheringtonii TaxID=911720 RepID=A0AAD6GPB7_9EURO|nr:hypothetical protein N7450_007826 [Penicillium hetheringtonii]
MAAVRLRKAFRYPEESDDDREEMDEEEQERVIQQLQQQNESRNAQYSLVFTAIPLFSTLVFLSLLRAGGASERMLSFLSIISLLATAYTMRSAPLYRDLKGKKPLSPRNERLEMIHTALIPLNGAVCTLLALIYVIFLDGDSFHINPAFYLIPGVMLMIIILAKHTMLEVDLATLKDLQYEYKGA